MNLLMKLFQFEILITPLRGILHPRFTVALRARSTFQGCSWRKPIYGYTLRSFNSTFNTHNHNHVLRHSLVYIHYDTPYYSFEPTQSQIKYRATVPPTFSNTDTKSTKVAVSLAEKDPDAVINSELSKHLPNEPKPDPNKPTLWQKVKKEVVHYYHGFRLLGLEVKIASGICFRLLLGETLTRRERKQLVRTVADIIRLVPFAVFLIVPFMEFLLPFYLRFFPFMLPSTFKEKGSESTKIRNKLKAKLEMTRFLQETLNQTTSQRKEVDNSPTVSEFQAFLTQVQKSGQPANIEEVTRFSKLFEDQVTLDSLEGKQLKMLCQLLSLPTIGPSNLLRFQIWMRVRQLKAEDRLIAKEGVDSIPPWELLSLCQERGMRSAGLTEERLRSQLNQWLTLQLEKNVPVTLLLFSQALHVTKATLEELPLQQAIAQLPSSVSEEATAVVMETTPSADVDPRTKIEVLRKEQANIEAARAARRKAAAEAAAIKDAEVLVDKAPVIGDSEKQAEDLAPRIESGIAQPSVVTLAPKEAPSTSVLRPSTDSVLPTTVSGPELSAVTAKQREEDEDTEITVGDLAQIETAIAQSSDALNHNELHELNEELVATTKRREKMGAQLVASEQGVDKRTSKTAARLGSRVDRMIAEMSGLIGNLYDERQVLLKDIEVREVHVKHSTELDEKNLILDAIKADHDRVIDINDLLLSLKRIQKVPDDTRWQRILQVLDEDKDGKIELQHVLSVIQLLGSENVKLSSKEVARVLEMLDNEELIEDFEAIKDQEVKPEEDASGCGCATKDDTTGTAKKPFSSHSSNKPGAQH